MGVGVGWLRQQCLLHKYKDLRSDLQTQVKNQACQPMRETPGGWRNVGFQSSLAIRPSSLDLFLGSVRNFVSKNKK